MKRKLLGLLLALCLMLGLTPVTAFAATEQPEALTVDGTDAFTTPQGEGWEFDRNTMTLTLDGYDGGAIVAHCNLTVILAQGSTNTITVTEGTALGNGTSFGTLYTLDIKGEGNTRPVLNLTGVTHAIHSTWNMTMENCDITAVNESPMQTSGDMECIQSEWNLTVTNCRLNLTSNGVGLTCFDHLTITDSDVAVQADVVGIHANNEGLVIKNTALNVTGTSNGALQSRFGGVYLTACTGTLSSENTGIISKNVDGDEITQLTDTDLIINAKTGILSYSDVVVENGSLVFNAETGIQTTKEGNKPYTTDVRIYGTASVSGSGRILVKALGSYTCEDTAKVDGITVSQNGALLMFVGQINIPDALEIDQELIIDKNAKVVIEKGGSLDLSNSPRVTINGSLENNGELKLDGRTVTNNGTIVNNGAVVERDGTRLKNNGTITSGCDSLFPVDGNTIILSHDLTETAEIEAACTTPGRKAYFTCQNAGCGKHFEDASGTIEITDLAHYGIIPALGHHYENGICSECGEKAPDYREDKGTGGGNAKWYKDGEDSQLGNGKKDPDREEYEVVSGRDQSWIRGSEDGISIRIASGFGEVTNVTIGGEELTADKDYTVIDGMIIIEPAVLEVRKEGKYAITVNGQNGYAVAAVRIEPKPAAPSAELAVQDEIEVTIDNPQTGDSGDLMLLSIMFVLSASALGTLLCSPKEKERSEK